ncbi:MAG: acyl-CoA dehydrogenase [Gammaproteobacteria bacterium]|nr:acyl-CoA dehydrogenase [Gammaproteobacteria bacterium]
MGWVIWIAVIASGLFALARIRASLKIWTGALAVVLIVLGWSGYLAFPPGVVLWGLWLIVALMNFPGPRRSALSAPLLDYVRRVLPPMSQTEKTAIQAGGVWWDAELFQGNPQWSRLLNTPAPRLTEEEQTFIDGPVETLCRMLDDWQITHELNDLPPAVWAFLKANRIFGMIIPKSYGGHGFSALAHSTVVMKITSRSCAAAVTVMVPNSLGPAELLLHYGTDKQKNHYLPRLARGEEIPCFALTAPTAGSDAGAIPDFGVICRGEYQGQIVLGLRLTWDKRYITLAPVASVLGLAFKAVDPDHLLGDAEELGITCALIPTDTPGVNIGRRHNPLDTAFQNGPTSGRDVFIPMDWIIGGQAQVGRGWAMLMECLSVGRGISLPALGTGLGKHASRYAGAYAAVRKQFGLPIGHFEGVEEVLARIGGLTYMMDAARLLTAAAIDAGERPSVVSAIVKYHNTEAMRQVINDAMDIHGGRGICLGARNYLASGYKSTPVSITVEGANILTRGLIIFGQGALRCHPYLVREMDAACDPDREAGLAAFDLALFSHLGYGVRNAARALLYGLTGGRLSPAPVAAPTARYYQHAARMSAAFAVIADVAMLLMGGALKRKEKLSGRFADALGCLFLLSAALKRFEDTGRPRADLPLVEWVAQYCLYRVQDALDGVLRNFPSRVLGVLLRVLVFPLGRRFRYPADPLGTEIANLLLTPSAARDRLTAGIHISSDSKDAAGRVEYALQQTTAIAPVEHKLRAALIKPPSYGYGDEWLHAAVVSGIITTAEAAQYRTAQQAVMDAIQVDDFPQTLGADAQTLAQASRPAYSEQARS